MSARHIDRRTVLKMAGGTLLASMAGGVLSQAGPSRQQLRIGTVMPSRTGLNPVLASVNDHPGDGGRMGAILADQRVGDEANREGLLLEVLLANSPGADAAYRAASRLVATEEVHALVGGVGAGQAEAIAEVAAAADVPFFNVGDSSDRLRQRFCDAPVFHLEASGAMYLDAMVSYHAAAQPRNWFVVHESTEDGDALGQRAIAAIARHDPAGGIGGVTGVAPAQPVYINEGIEIQRSGADIVLLLIEARDQIAFLGQIEDLGLDLAVACFPDVVSQTRDYMAASRQNAPGYSPSIRFAAWDVSLTDHGAWDFNDRFTSRWGEVANPTAWMTYEAIELITRAALVVPQIDPVAISVAIANPDTSFDMRKGVPLSFRSWDRQLRQPIYAINVDPEAPWNRLSLSSRIEIASVVAELPTLDGLRDRAATRVETDAALDTLGDGPTEACQAS